MKGFVRFMQVFIVLEVAAILFLFYKIWELPS